MSCSHKDFLPLPPDILSRLMLISSFHCSIICRFLVLSASGFCFSLWAHLQWELPFVRLLLVPWVEKLSQWRGCEHGWVFLFLVFSPWTSFHISFLGLRLVHFASSLTLGPRTKWVVPYQKLDSSFLAPGFRQGAQVHLLATRRDLLSQFQPHWILSKFYLLFSRKVLIWLLQL